MRILLGEWGLVFSHVTIMVDNTAAITTAENGSSWRTRYFGVRGSRMNEEISQGNLKLMHEPTAKMLADSLTKLGTAQMLRNIRGAMVGERVSEQE